MKYHAARKGSVIFLTLVIVLILFFYATAVTSRNVMSLHQTRHSLNALSAQQMAQAGLNHMLNRLAYMENFGASTDDNITYTTDDGNHSYFITFDTKNQYYSINNLASMTEHPSVNFEGLTVHPCSADIVVNAVSGIKSSQPVTRRLNVVLRRTLEYDLSLGADGKIAFHGKTHIDGIESMITFDTKIGGGTHSNFPYSEVEASPSISLDVPYDLKLGKEATISCTGIASKTLSYLDVREFTSPKPLPYFSIIDIIDRKKSSPPPPGIVYSAGANGYVSKYLNVLKENYVHGNLVVNGDLNLVNATLYVDGDLTINGGIRGYGGLFVRGDITITGGSIALLTNQINSSAVFAGGDILVQGLSTSDYLSLLSDQYPEIKDKYKIFKSQYETLRSFLESKEKNGQWDFISFKNEFGDPDPVLRKMFIDGKEGNVLPPSSGVDEDRVAAVCIWWASYKLAGPQENSSSGTFTFEKVESNGIQSIASADATIPSLILQIEESCAELAESEPGIRRTLQGLTDIAYFLRHPYSDKVFHDSDLPLHSQSLAHLLWYTVNPNGEMDKSNITQILSQPKEKEKEKGWKKFYKLFKRKKKASEQAGDLYALTPGEFIDIANDFIMANNPLDTRWAENSSLQGILYANGNITVTNKFNVYGSVIANGDVSLRESSITYVAEFMTLFGYTTPLQVVKYKEI